MSPFEVKHIRGHMFLLWRGVLIWKLAKDGRSSYLFQTAPYTAERLDEM